MNRKFAGQLDATDHAFGRQIKRIAFAAAAVAWLMGGWFAGLPLSFGQQASSQPGATAVDTSRGDQMIAQYFQQQTAQLRDNCLAGIQTREQWEAVRGKYRQQLLEMLGLDPLPPRGDLKATITGKAVHNEFVVEKVHFQSVPGLYVTGNLYIPRDLTEPAPAILYVCGHGATRKNGVSFGNKVTYQHHPAWFARNGYVCLIIDSLQLGEIEGIHHGTYRYNMWWWLNRGYTPAGVEAWNCVRALDYLETRKEVDRQRIGVTGRSGGGAYSWWIAAIDERIQVAVPVAGITDLQNHVVDGTVEGHCDCMFFSNTYQWDYPLVAALVAPRPLLISNTDRDRIFPLDGVVRTYFKVRKIYELYGAEENLALNITAGPHKDTQELRVHAFRWFNHFLKGDDSLIDKTAVPFFEPEDLKVFDQLPKDQINTTIQERFVSVAPTPPVPESPQQWQQMRDGWRAALMEKTFRAWPKQPEPLQLDEAWSAVQQGVRLRAIDFTSQGPIRLRLYVAHRDGLPRPNQLVLHVLDQPGWQRFLAAMRPAFDEQFKSEALAEADPEAWKNIQQQLQSSQVLVYVAPRGVGPTAWDMSERKQIQQRRRFYLLGQTLDGMRVWDVQQAIRALRSDDWLKSASIRLAAEGPMAGVVLYASLFVPDLGGLELSQLPRSHRDGPFLLNVAKILDLPQTVAMAAEQTSVVIHQDQPHGWEYPQAVIQKLGWPANRLVIRQPPATKK